MKKNDIISLIGDTPLVELERYGSAEDLGASVFAKLESFNPGGSAKDRIAKYMIEDAEKKGKIGTGSVIIEPTSGNTGIGLALVAGAKGYRTVLTMPETMSAERRDLLKAYGAELVLTQGSRGMTGAIEKASELASEYKGGFIPGQFDNPANPRAHYETTGPEIWRDLEGRVDIFIAGVGSGGTVTGTGRYLKEKDPSVKIVAVEPASSAVLSGKAPGSHGIQGIGAGFVPSVLDMSVIDEVVAVADDDAFDSARKLAKRENILAGISSGAALWAAVQIAERSENKGKNVAVLLPDTGERYLSCGLF